MDINSKSFKRIERLLHRANVQLINNACGTDVDKLNENVRKADHFQEPTNERWIEQHRRFRPEGFYRLHCSHDRPMWMTCGTCRRGKKEADGNFIKAMTGKL